MLPFLGIAMVFAAVALGYRLESSDWKPLIQPAEYLIICGSALGTLLVANPLPVICAVLRDIPGIFQGPRYCREIYLESIVMLYELFDFSRRLGMSRLDEELDDPSSNEICLRHVKLLRDRSMLDFVCDSMRLVAFETVWPFDFDEILARDIELRGNAMSVRVRALEQLADAFPGLGIVAAVLGVVITMGSLSVAPKLVGPKVASALVGTFVGIILSYGAVAPAAAHLLKIRDAEVQYYEVLRCALSGFARGLPPVLAVEMARRAIPPDLRPDFETLQTGMRAVRVLRAKAA